MPRYAVKTGLVGCHTQDHGCAEYVEVKKILLVACYATLHPAMLDRWSPFWAAALKGPMTYAFTHMKWDFLLLLLLLRPPPGFEAQIAASSPNHSLELESQAQGSISNLMA